MSLSRSFLLLLTVSTLSILLGPGPVLASGNVLLPSSNTPTSTPNLGLVPHTDAPADLSSTNSASLPSSIPAVPPTSNVPASTALLPNLSSPDTSDALLPKTAPKASSATIFNATHVIKMPANDLNSSQTEAALPNLMSIAVDTNSVWSADNLKTISQKLGIPESQIPSLCHLSASGLVSTDKGVYLFDTGASSQASVRYDGNVSSTVIAGKALCSLVPLPPNAGIVTQVTDRSPGMTTPSDYYSVNLPGATCAQNTRSPMQLSIAFGKTKTSCGLQ